MRKKILTLALLVGAMLLLTATGVLAASPAVSNPHPILQEPPPPETITNPVAAMIAAFFGLDYTQVQAWHDDGTGYGNMTIALFFAEASGLTFGQIMAMRGREEGGGWGYIIKELGLDIKRRDTNLGAIMSGRALTDTMTGTLQVEAKRGRGRPQVPPGWERGRGLGLGRGPGRGHNQ